MVYSFPVRIWSLLNDVGSNEYPLYNEFLKLQLIFLDILSNVKPLFTRLEYISLSSDLLTLILDFLRSYDIIFVFCSIFD